MQVESGNVPEGHITLNLERSEQDPSTLATMACFDVEFKVTKVTKVTINFSVSVHGLAGLAN